MCRSSCRPHLVLGSGSICYNSEDPCIHRWREGLIMSEQYKALQGFKDILPDEQPYWRMVERVAVEVANLYGYRRIETPVLEETAVFLRTAGVGTDIVEKEMYSFDDRADKEGNRPNLTLRPEGTAGVVRAY